MGYLGMLEKLFWTNLLVFITLVVAISVINEVDIKTANDAPLWLWRLVGWLLCLNLLVFPVLGVVWIWRSV